MIIIDAVVETYGTDRFTAWPTADATADYLLALGGQLTPAEVGTAMAVLAGYNDLVPEDEASAEAGELIRGLIAADGLIAPGGLRVRDTDSGIAVPPGCCCGLESWREWLEVPRGEQPWLGHDPWPWIELADQRVRVWPDGGDQSEPVTGTPIEIPVAELPGLCAAAQQDLRDFLDLVQEWAGRFGPEQAGALVAALDRHFHISGSA